MKKNPNGKKSLNYESNEKGIYISLGENRLNAFKRYGDVLFKRAIGKSPEMESSKAAAKIIKDIIKENYQILDVGCGPGHYFRSLKNKINTNFKYSGVDVNSVYIELAQEAFKDYEGIDFQLADINNIPFEDNSKDIVMCCNVLLHIPSIKKPIEELCRIAKQFVLIRTLIGDRSFRIMEVHEQENGDEFELDGSPKSYNFYNIYSKSYILNILSNLGINNIEFVEDTDFKRDNIEAAVSEQSNVKNVTRIIGKWQVNTFVLQPWTFIKIFK